MIQKLFWSLIFPVFLLSSACNPSTKQKDNLDPEVLSTVKPVQQNAPNTGGSNSGALSLTINNLNSTPPEDILSEVDYFGGMGGGDQCFLSDYTAPTITSGLGEIQLLDELIIQICGLSVGENIHVIVELPDNTIREYYTVAEETEGQTGQLYFEYNSELKDPSGTYHLIFEGNNWSLDYYVKINNITSPSLFLDMDRGAYKLMFVNFKPNEHVRLFVYKEDYLAHVANLVGWTNLRIDENGNLVVFTDYQDGYYVAIGEVSGEVYFRYANSRFHWQGGPITK